MTPAASSTMNQNTSPLPCDDIFTCNDTTRTPHDVVNTSDNAAPLVTVIVPIYNAEATLEQALVSIGTQTITNIEVLCINDGSTDGSLAIAQRFAENDTRMQVIDKPNEGYGATCNDGITRARGTWVAIVEPDDWIDPSMFEEMVTAADDVESRMLDDGKNCPFTPIDIIKTPFWRILPDDELGKRRLNCSYKGLVKPSVQPFTIAHAPELLRHHPSIWSALYRRDFLLQNNICFPKIAGAGWADNPFMMETLCAARAIVYLDKAFYNYRFRTAADDAAFLRANPTLPFERWRDTQDVLKRLEVSDPTILQAHIERGFLYLDQVKEAGVADNKQTQQAIEQMFVLMNQSLVFTSERISPAHKRSFAQARNIDCPPINTRAYRSYLLKRGLHNIRNTGIKQTLRDVMRYMRRQT